ncbi:cation diffusion facilitator CzcD-associated flavoprotein CzcO [Roseibium hamelinense]|uniref:Trimethylamine monooxygenase n=1 Tax=Roseibium hamelinense TaxID=150831 RepID=A0A562THN8_9HYPH|nr:NAD(P)-binding domain-containing protein [Roseibium hamelinense]MTI45630.1 NAD(P)/FAD-dependent oxidoreductase [Roseibium hamelinense]TWI93189.1 cation diffusion facilitator CzcD-associated flavoprotein CzcO [Roseibium hamelinense]
MPQKTEPVPEAGLPDTLPDTRDQYALIGAGPMGLAMAKVLREQGIAFQGFEMHSDVGGVWDITGPRSTMYESAHLISSKTTTEFADFPMPDGTPDYPSHRQMRQYFQSFAKHFGLYGCYSFKTEVLKAVPIGPSGAGWRLTWKTQDGREHQSVYKGLLIANGTLSTPRRLVFEGNFEGELIHAADYKSARQFNGKRVLIVGAGNSGCDMAVDAVHHAKSVDLSMRRGYYFVPKYVFGRAADTLNGTAHLPMWLKRKIDSVILRWFAGDPQRYGFPKPDYKLYESHPVVNSLILFHAGHGDVGIKPDIARLNGKIVQFSDGTQASYDMIVTATGYVLDYPFIDKALLNWTGAAPDLFLNCMHPDRDDLFVLGMVEATGLGWQGRHEQAELVARYIKGLEQKSTAADAIRREKANGFKRQTGGIDYLKLDRMAYYVDKTSYRRALTSRIASLQKAAS